MLQLTYSHTCTGKYSIYMCDQSSDLGAGYCHHHTDTIQHYSHTYTHAHSRMHSLTHTHTPRPQTLDWFRLIVPVSCLVLSQSKSLPGYTDNVYIVWLLDRAIVSFTLPPGLFFFPPLSPTSFFSSPSFSLSFSLPFVLPHFLTLLLSPPLLQLFLAGSCMQWLSPPQKQKTLREEWFEYRFVPQSSEFYPFF